MPILPCGRAAMTRYAPSVLATFLAVGLLASCGESAQTVSRQDFIMDTAIVLTINAPSQAAGERAAEAVFARLREIDARVRVQADTSELAKVNAAAGQTAVAVSADTLEMSVRALELARMTGGAFDPTIGPVSRLWDIEGENPRVPSAPDLAAAMDLVDWHGVEADPAAGTLRLTRAGMRLDFGGVAKGFAALEAARICREAGIDSALLNMGDSSIYALGAKPGGKKWRIGIQNPTAGQEGVERGKMLGVVEVAGQVVESSGTYERFFVQDGKAYHHIMDPATGHPVDNGLVQVTLILPGDTRWADGLSTSVFVLGPARGLELIEGMPEAAAILVFADKRVLLSRRAAGLFTLDAAGYRLVSADELEK